MKKFNASLYAANLVQRTAHPLTIAVEDTDGALVINVYQQADGSDDHDLVGRHDTGLPGSEDPFEARILAFQLRDAIASFRRPVSVTEPEQPPLVKLTLNRNEVVTCFREAMYHTIKGWKEQKAIEEHIGLELNALNDVIESNSAVKDPHEMTDDDIIKAIEEAIQEQQTDA